MAAIHGSWDEELLAAKGADAAAVGAAAAAAAALARTIGERTPPRLLRKRRLFIVATGHETDPMR